MRVYKGNRKLDDIISTAKVSGWEVDTEIYDSGGDWIWIRDMQDRMLQIVLNTFNGQFKVYAPVSDRPIATETSKEFDNEDWYSELLDMFYEGV